MSHSKNLLAHLMALLPLPNPSGGKEPNPVAIYARRELEAMGRTVETDDWGNVLALGTSGLGIVAHTDSVGQDGAKAPQRVKLKAGIIRGEGRRPIGGDDKVGIAIALTLAAKMPRISVILTADEEIGCVGASQVKMPCHRLLVECDRKGAEDMVTCIAQPLLSQEGVYRACKILPHRRECDGLMTDVDELSRRRLAESSVNLSCGYYGPHTANEIVVLAHAEQAMIDAGALLQRWPAKVDPCWVDWHVKPTREEGD